MSLFHTKTVAEQIVEELVAAGVERIYGLTGDSLNSITDAVRRSGKIDWVHVRHEEAAAFMASAEAQLTGKLAVCAASCGPGSLHLLNGLYDAHRSMAPVLALATHIPSDQIGMGYFQETHPERLFQECSVYCELVSSAAQMPRLLQIAMQNAVGKGGVGVVILPGDIAAQKLPSDALQHPIVTSKPTVRPADAEIEKLAAMINGAGRVTLFCGAGCRDAHAEMLQLAQIAQAPVGYAYRGKQYVEHDNPHAVGMTGLLGWGACFDAMHGCDLLVLLGTDFPYPNFYPTGCEIAQVELRPEHVGRRCRVDMGLLGDVGETLRALMPLLTPKTDSAFLDKMLAEHRKKVYDLGVYTRDPKDDALIHPEFLAATINEVAAADAVFTVDTGEVNIWEAHFIRAARDRRFLISASHGSMANALPFAIAAQKTYPDRQVISLSGDGGLAMLMGELLTVVQYDLPVKIVVFNNGVLGFVQLEMEAAGYPAWQTDLKNPNFAKMAEAIGMLGVRVEQSSDLKAGLARALAHPGPALIDVVTDANALSMPPKITAQQAKGFSLTMGKLVLSGDAAEVAKIVESNLRNAVNVSL